MRNQTFTVFMAALNPLFLTVLTLLVVGVVYLYVYEYVSAVNSVYLYVLSLLIASSIKVAQEWEKAVVLRMGKFHSLRGPGFFLIVPIIERVNSYIDQRVRVTDTKAENTLTRDTVPCSWMRSSTGWSGTPKKQRWRSSISRRPSNTSLRLACET